MPNQLALLWRGIREVGLRPTWDAVLHTLRSRWIEARFGGRLLPSSPALDGPLVRTLGPLVDHSQSADELRLTFAHAVVTITARDAATIRVRLEPHTAPPSTATHQEAVTLRTARLTCTVAPDGTLTLRDAAGNLVAAEAAPAGWTAAGHAVCRYRIPATAHFYGLGQRAAPLDRRGGRFVNWNTDPRAYSDGDDPLDLCVPFLLTLHDEGRQGYGLLLHNTVRSHLDVGQHDPSLLTVRVEEERLEYDLIYGPALGDVLERFTTQTGRPVLLPRWALGYHQSRWSYYPAARVRQLARDLRHTYRIPCDAIHLDIHYMDGYRCFTWDEERFPDPAALIADLHAEGLRVVTIIDPGIKADRRYPVFAQGLERDAFCRTPDGKLFIGPVWPGNCAFPDFTAPHVRRWWGELHRDLVAAGVDGIWDDMNEPALFGDDGATIPGPVRHDLEGRGGDHLQAHNVYGLGMVRATAAGLERLRPDRRPFVLTRSGWTSVQRYAANWSGDNRATWESLRLTLPMLLGLGLSGVTFSGADVGGFAGFPSGELFTRWLQLGVFLPFFRAHTDINSPDQEPWAWGEPYLSINRETIRFRYHLLPYLYTAHWQSTQRGLPLARPLFLAFQDDPATWGLEDEFLCGDALLVAPVLHEGAVSRTVYLPPATWYDFWSGERHDGPAQVEIEAPLERIPLFVRAGTVLPLWPPLDHTGQRVEQMELHLYPGTGRSLLYEDDGESMAYQRGEHRLTTFDLVASSTRLELTRRVSGPFDLGYSRFEVVIHDAPGMPRRVEGLPQVETTFDAASRTLWLRGGPFDRLTVEF